MGQNTAKPIEDSAIPKDFSKFRNRHAGETIVVCGCGASLNDIENPENFITIGVNDIGRLFDPTYLVVLNPKSQFKGDRFQYVEYSRAQAIFTQLDLDLDHPNIVCFKLGVRGGTDISDSYSLPYTQNSPYLAVCLAVFMGAKRVGLIGVDFTDHHFFAKTGRHSLSGRLAQIDQEYARLVEALTKRDVEVVNLSRQSLLHSIAREDYRSFCRRVKAEHNQTYQNTLPLHDNVRPAVSGQASDAVILKVAHVALTNCAGSLWNLHDLFRKYSDIQSRVITASPITNGRSYPKDVLLSESNKVASLLEEADLIHFHNYIDKQSPEMAPFRKTIESKPAVLQFHSEPAVLRTRFPGRDVITRNDIVTLVIAQKHVRFFPNAIAVPNALDIHAPLLKPRENREEDILRVVYTPTDTNTYSDYSKTCRGKGYCETVSLLSELQEKRIIEAIIRTNVPWEELMQIRGGADVVIDECVTGGYHLTSLEGLSQGVITIASLDETMRLLLCQLTGCTPSELPWLNTPLSRLKQTLLLLADNPFLRQVCRHTSRQWMERYWTPEFILQHYRQAYQRAFEVSIDKQVPSERQASAVAGVSKRDQDRDLAATNQNSTEPNVTGSSNMRYAVFQRLPGIPNPSHSQDFPQTIRLGTELLNKRGALLGKSCHILGNGPSVKDFDLSLLHSHAVIGVNATPLLHDALGRATDYYCVSDRRFLQDQASLELAATARDSIRVFAGYCEGFVCDPDIHYVRILGSVGVSDDLDRGFYHAYSVVLFAAQLALWLGCSKLFLHGCEYDYRYGRFSKEQNNRPYDRGTYSHIERSAQMLSAFLTAKNRKLYVVEPSRLLGDFGAQPIKGIQRVTVAQLEEILQ